MMLMANEPTMTISASANFDKLKAKLRELFELDKADLDFGIYRILRQRHAEITEFLDKHLEKTVREALESHGGLQQAQVADDLRKAEQAAQAAGITPEQSPRVMELRAKLSAGTDLNALADEVYSHLLTFFSRYYQEGDFLGLKVKQIDTQKGFLTVTGGKRAGGRTLVIWRTLSDDPVKDNEALDKFLARLQINPADTEFDFIYVNGSHTLADPHNKVHLIEETFARLMFEAQDFETLSE